MSVHDPKVTLNQIRDAAARAQQICAGRTLENLLQDWQVTCRGSAEDKPADRWQNQGHLASARSIASFVSSATTRFCPSGYKTSLRSQWLLVPVPTNFKRSTPKAPAFPLKSKSYPFTSGELSLNERSNPLEVPFRDPVREHTLLVCDILWKRDLSKVTREVCPKV